MRHSKSLGFSCWPVPTYEVVHDFLISTFTWALAKTMREPPLDFASKKLKFFGRFEPIPNVRHVCLKNSASERSVTNHDGVLSSID